MLVFQLITTAAVVTNSACIFYTVRWQPFEGQRLRPPQRAFAFFVYQYMVFALMLGLMVVVPDVPEDVQIQIQRQQRLAVSRLLVPGRQGRRDVEQKRRPKSKVPRGQAHRPHAGRAGVGRGGRGEPAAAGRAHALSAARARRASACCPTTA